MVSPETPIFRVSGIGLQVRDGVGCDRQDASMEPNPRTALVDESIRRGVDGRGYALLVAVIVPDVAAAEIERDLRQLVYAGQRRFHWRDERPASRRKFMSKVAGFDELDVVALAYCQETPSQRKVQQARVRSIWTLLADLAERHVGTLVFESRQERNDVKDRREVLAAQQAGVANRDLVYRHGRPKEEPLLWLADAIAGGVGEKIARENGEFVELLPDGMWEIRWIDRL